MHSHAATARIREGESNELANRLADDPLFAGVDLVEVMQADNLAGRAAVQVEDFVAGAVQTALIDCPARVADEPLKV